MWAIGQAMALDRSLALFATARGTEGIFPEFYFFDCHSCHRQISDDPRFRPGALANPGRPIPSGMPPFNDENMIMLAAAARVVAPGARRSASSATAAPSTPRSPRDRAAGRRRGRRRCAQARGRSPTPSPRRRWAATQTFAIIDAITGEALRDALHRLCRQRPGGDGDRHPALGPGQRRAMSRAAAANAIRADINGAYRAVHDPNAYDPGGFRASLGRAAAAIRRLR